MKIEMLDYRRFFRNRFELFAHHNDTDGSGAGDGCALGLGELCGILATDDEGFPHNYNRDLRRLCGHEANIWFREERSYGDVARLVTRLLAARSGGNTRPSGFWISEVLHCNSPIDAMRSPTAANGGLNRA